MNIGFDIPLSGAKRLFFDRDVVMQAVELRERAYLNYAGGYVRQTARNSMGKRTRIRSRKDLGDLPKAVRRLYHIRVKVAKREGTPKPKLPFRQLVSRPGQPPMRQTELLYRFILYSFDDSTSQPSVVIGPAKLGTKSAAPKVLEIGGTATIQGREGRADREVRIEARPYMAPALASASTSEQTRKFWTNATLKF